MRRVGVQCPGRERVRFGGGGGAGAARKKGSGVSAVDTFIASKISKRGGGGGEDEEDGEAPGPLFTVVGVSIAHYTAFF